MRLSPWLPVFLALAQALPQTEVPGERLSDPGWSDEHPVVTSAKDGRRWVAWIAYQDGSDAVAVHGGGPVIRVTESGDHHGPAIAIDGRGWVRVVWAQRDGAEFQVYESVYLAERWSRAARLSTPGTSNIAPAMAADGEGRIGLVWQSLRGGQSAIMARVFDGRSWSPERQISAVGNAWLPAVAWGGGKLWIAWDSYVAGNYQIYAREIDGGTHRVTSGSGFSVRPSIAVTPRGEPVVGWEESDARLGPDLSFFANRDSASFTQDRRLRAATLSDGEWRDLPSPMEALPAAHRQFAQHVRLSADAAGRIYLACRVRITPEPSGGLWRSYWMKLSADGWSAASALSPSPGSGSQGPAVHAAIGSVHFAWPSVSASGEVDIFAATRPQ